MTKVNIREALNQMDKDTNCKYDLVTLYEGYNFNDEEKKEIAKMISDNEDAEVIYDRLSDKFGKDVDFDDDDISDIKESFGDDLIDSQYVDDISDGHWSWDYDDDELANIYGGDTKYDNHPDGVDIDESLNEDTQLKLFDDDMINDIEVLHTWRPEEVERILIKHGSDKNNDNWIDGLDLPAAYDEIMSTFRDKYSDYDEIDYGAAKVLGLVDESLNEGKIIESSSDWRFVDSKPVPDSNGFMDDYVWYENTKDGRHVFVFGDKDLYDDVDSDQIDWEVDSYSEARHWFDSYNGFDEDAIQESYKLGDKVTWHNGTYIIIDDEDDLFVLRPVGRFQDSDFDDIDSGDSSEDVFLSKFQLTEDVTQGSDPNKEVAKQLKQTNIKESLSPQKGDRVRMDHYSKLNNGQEGTVTGRIGELCSVTWDDGTKSKEIKGYLTVIERDGKVVKESFDDDLISAEQEFDSAATSINSSKLPAVYNMVKFNPGDVVVDFGGGKFDNAVNYLKDQDVTLLVYDPYNRSAEHNKDVLRVLKEHGGADAAVNSNVLNVIKEPEARKSVLQNIKKITKKGAPIYITVYEGTGKGNEGPTKSGYQLNRKTSDYMDEISHVFSNVTRKGKLITAINESLTEDDKSTAFNDKYFPRVDINNTSRYDTAEFKNKFFAYDKKNNVLIYLFKDDEEVSEMGWDKAPWRELDSAGLSSDNWNDKESREDYLHAYTFDLDSESSYLVQDFIDNELPYYQSKNESVTDPRYYKMVEYNYDGDDISNYLGHVRVRTNSDKVALRAAEKYAMSKHPEDNPRHFKIVDDNYTNVDVVDSDGDYLTTLESIDESKSIKESDEETPYTKEEIERDLKSITHNFTDKEGELKCGFEEEKNFGAEILKQHYKVVEVSGDDRRDGTWYHISFAEPLIDESKSIKESSLVDKKVSTLGKRGKPMYFTAAQLKDAKEKYPEYDFEETTIEYSLPAGQKAYIARRKTNESKSIKESSSGPKYVTRDIINKTNSQKLKDAYDEGELEVLINGDVWYTERCPEGLGKELKAEMKRLYPDIKHLYDESKSIKEDYSDEVVTLRRYLDVEVPDICREVLDLVEYLPSHKISYATKICRDFYANMENIIKNYTMTGDNLKESSYGGAYDIADDEYFTKEDGMIAANEVAYQLEKEFPEAKLEVMDMQLDNHSFYVVLTDKDGNEFTEEITLDMRKIRHPLDLIKKYAPALTERFIKQIKDYYSEM